jgi:hypothetical protein
MRKPLEVLLLAGFWFIAMAWIEWDYNPQGWHWVTRLAYIVMLVLVMVVATYPGRPGVGQKGVGKN